MNVLAGIVDVYICDHFLQSIDALHALSKRYSVTERWQNDIRGKELLQYCDGSKSPSIRIQRQCLSDRAYDAATAEARGHHKVKLNHVIFCRS